MGCSIQQVTWGPYSYGLCSYGLRHGVQYTTGEMGPIQLWPISYGLRHGVQYTTGVCPCLSAVEWCDCVA